MKDGQVREKIRKRDRKSRVDNLKRRKPNILAGLQEPRHVTWKTNTGRKI